MERLIEKVCKTSGNGLLGYDGTKNPYDVCLTIGEIIGSYSKDFDAREVLSEVFTRLYEYEDTGLTPEEVAGLLSGTAWTRFDDKKPDKKGTYLVADGLYGGEYNPTSDGNSMALTCLVKNPSGHWSDSVWILLSELPQEGT